MPIEHGNHHCQISHFALFHHGTCDNACFQRSTKVLKFCPCIFHLLFPTAQLNGFRSSRKLFPTFSMLWHLFLVFTKLFRCNTCRILIVWDADVLLVDIVTKHGNTIWSVIIWSQLICWFFFFPAVMLHCFIGLGSKMLHCHLNWITWEQGFV